MKYLVFIATVSQIFWSDLASSLTCPRNWSAERAYDEAGHYLVIKVSAIYHDEKLTEALAHEFEVDRDELASRSYKYRVVETLKGNSTDLPKIFTYLNVGMGGVYLKPRRYYLISMVSRGIQLEDEYYYPLTYCNVHEVGRSVKSGKFAQRLRQIRVYAAERKKKEKGSAPN